MSRSRPKGFPRRAVRPISTYSKRGRVARRSDLDDDFVFPSPLEPEHDSVEPVDDADGDSDGEYKEYLPDRHELAASKKERPRRERRSKRGQVEDADVHLNGPQRRRLKESGGGDGDGKDKADLDEIDFDLEELSSSALSPAEMKHMTAQMKECRDKLTGRNAELADLIRRFEVLKGTRGAAPTVETATLAQVKEALELNSTFLKTLRDQYAFYVARHGEDHPAAKRIEQMMAHTLGVMTDWGLPIAQAGPIQHAVPPTIPQADGSEKRFTDEARKLGLKWHMVSEADKMEVYNRAIALHVEHYGSRPTQVNMWTSDGWRPTYYYNEDTYQKTMLRALTEYMNRITAAAVNSDLE